MLRYQFLSLLLVLALPLSGCGKVKYVNNDASGAAAADQVGKSGEAGKNSESQGGGDIDQTDAGETTGGETTGGETTGGETTGGETTGGETAGGETAGGETAGGETAGGETAGGETAGETEAALMSIELRPATAVVPTGLNHYFQIFGKFDDDSEQDLTEDREFLFSAPGDALQILGVELGLLGVKGIKAGTATLEAAFGDLTATAEIEVLDVNFISFKLDPSIVSVNVGEIVTLTGIGVGDTGDEYDVTFNTSFSAADSTIATVGDNLTNKGKVTGVKVGTTEVTATFGTLTATVPVVVLEAGTMLAAENFNVQAVPAQLDIIFTIDNSPSMRKAIANVQSNIEAFSTFIASKTDAKVHVLSAKTTPITIRSDTGEVIPYSLYQPIVAPISPQITQYDVLVDSGDVAIAAAVATCPKASNHFEVGGQSKICDESVTNINGVDQSFKYGIGPEFEDRNDKLLFELANGTMVDNLREKSKRVYVMVTNSDIISNADLSTGSKTLDHNTFAAAVGRFSYDYPTVYSFAKLPDVDECALLTPLEQSLSEDAVDLQTLTNATMGKSYDLCALSWSAQFDELAADTLSLKDNIFTVANAEVVEVIRVSQGGVAIDPSQYKVNGNVITVHPSVVELSDGSSADLMIEYIFRQ